MGREGFVIWGDARACVAQDKDSFLEFYLQHLSKRLLGNRHSSMHAEEEAVSRMRAAFGMQFTRRVSGLVANYRLAADTPPQRTETVDEFRALVLEQGKWPAFSMFADAQLPGPMLAMLTFAFRNVPQENWARSAAEQGYLLLAIFVIAFVYFLDKWMRWGSTIYAVTDERIITQRGILSKEYDDVELPMIASVDVSQPFSKRMLGYGTIRFSISGSAGRKDTVTWEWVPDPLGVRRKVQEVMDIRVKPKNDRGA